MDSSSEPHGRTKPYNWSVPGRAASFPGDPDREHGAGKINTPVVPNSTWSAAAFHRLCQVSAFVFIGPGGRRDRLEKEVQPRSQRPIVYFLFFCFRVEDEGNGLKFKNNILHNYIRRTHTKRICFVWWRTRIEFKKFISAVSPTLASDEVLYEIERIRYTFGETTLLNAKTVLFRAFIMYGFMLVLIFNLVFFSLFSFFNYIRLCIVSFVRAKLFFAS